MRMTALNILGEWASQFRKSHGKAAYDIATAAVVHTFACMLAGVPELSAEIIRKTITPWSSGPYRIAGGGDSNAPLPPARKERWGQVVTRLLGPEDLFLCITYTPSMWK